MNTLIANHYQTQTIDTQVIVDAYQQLKQQGWVLLRGFDMNIDRFSALLGEFCSHLTFDPAREYASNTTQKVDAGTDAIGLHIENGNTPLPPDMVAFYSRKSAKQGSQTTVCDGVDVFNAMSDELKQKLSQRITVSRTLPSHLWRAYVTNEHPEVSDQAEVRREHLEYVLGRSGRQRGQIDEDDSLHYELDIEPLIKGVWSSEMAFANAVLGPSFNYEKPVYRFADGSLLDEALKAELTELAEAYTHELNWHNGDVVLIDNKRVMHGRRAILGELSERELFIGMGHL